MRWVTVGRPGLSGRQVARRYRAYDDQFGAGKWRVMHLVAGQLLDIEAAAGHVETSYHSWFGRHPELLEWLCTAARDVIQSSTSNVQSGSDYLIQERKQEHVFDIAIRRVIRAMDCEFQGDRLVQIAGRKCEQLLLNPGRVPFHRTDLIAQPVLKGWWLPDSVACFWQSNRVLQVRRDAES